MASDDLAPWERETQVSIGAGPVQALPDGSYWIKRIIFFNSTAGTAVLQVHDHASALSDSDPIYCAVPAGSTVPVEGPFRFRSGVQIGSTVTNATVGMTIVYRRRVT